MATLKNKLIVALAGLFFGCVMVVFVFWLTFVAFPMTALYMGPFYGIYGKGGSAILHIIVPWLGVVLTYTMFFWLAVYKCRRLGLVSYAIYFGSYIWLLIADPENVSFIAYPHTFADLGQLLAEWYKYIPNWFLWTPFLVLSAIYLSRLLRK